MQKAMHAFIKNQQHKTWSKRSCFVLNQI
jgi:hypothetical protein